MADLGTISILVDVRGQPIVKELATNLSNVAKEEVKVSAATQRVMADFKRMQQITAMLKKDTDAASASFQRFSAKELQQASQRMQGFESSLANTRRGMGQMGMATQQVGYQVGDFLVQIQSGTNFMVAFGQQATQLVGILPAFSKQLGMSVGSLIGISSVLGIVIPLATAIGAAFMRTGEDASGASEGLDAYQKALEGVKSSIQSTQIELDKLTFGTEDPVMAAALKALEQAEQELAIARSSQRRIGNAIVPTSEELANLQQAVLNFTEMARLVRELEERNVALAEAQQMLNGHLSAAAGTQARLADEKMRELQAAQDLEAATINAHQAYAASRMEANQTAEQVALIESGMSQAAVDALKFAGVDLSSGVSAAAREAAVLAANMGIALSDAISIVNMRASEVYSGRGGDPRDFMEGGSKSYSNSVRPFVAIAKAASGAAKSISDAEKAAKDLQKQLESPLVSAVGSISDAFGDFVARGLRDFKGFVKSILASFQNMIAQMIAMAVKNRIMLSLGIGGITPTAAAAGQVAGLGSAGGMLGSLGIGQGIGGLSGGTGFLGGAGNAIAGLGGGGAGFFSVGANAAAAGGGALATIGAAVPVIAAVAAVVSLFKKKVTELDNGIKVTATGLDVLTQNFKTLQTSRFWGLSKKVSTEFSEATPEVEGFVNSYKQQLLSAIEILEISKDTFKDFSYELQISLKGLTEEQKLEKINQELGKFGDALAGLTEFGNARSLLSAAQSLRDFLDSLTPAQRALYDMSKGLSELGKISRSGDFSNAAEIIKKVNGVINSIGRAITGTIKELRAGLAGLAEANNVTTQFEKALAIGSQVGEFASQAASNLSRASNGIKRVEKFLVSMRRSGEFSDEDLAKLGRKLRSQKAALQEANAVVAAVSKVSGIYDKTVEAILSKPVDQAVSAGLLPKYMEDFSASVKSIITTVEKGDLDAFANAYANIVSLFGKGEISTMELSNSVQIMSEIVDGTTKSVNEFGQEFQKTINIIEDALKRLAGIREEVAPRESRQAALNYLREVASSGIKPAADALFEQSVATVSNVSTGDFASQVEMLRYIAETSALLSNIKGFASGGSFMGGMRVVGENGPELEITGPSRIYSAQQTKEILGGGGSNDNEALRLEVSQMRQELTAGLIQIAKNTSKTAATLNKFDYDGLPDSRGY